MKYRYWCLFFLTFAFCGCTSELFLPQPQSFSQEDLPLCVSRDCPKIAIEYLLYTPQNNREKQLNKAINSFIAASLYLEDPTKEPTALTTQEAAKGFVSSYWRDHAEFPDLAAEYFVEAQVTEVYRDEAVLSLEFKQYKYTGGAHGFQDISYINFNIKTGERLTNQTLFKDYDAFKDFVEITFRKKFAILPQRSINSNYFWFDDNVFTMPNSLGFNQDSLVLHYNQHEIASYRDAPVIVTIPLAQVKEFMN